MNLCKRDVSTYCHFCCRIGYNWSWKGTGSSYAMHLYGVRIDISKFSNSNTRYLPAVHEFRLSAFFFLSVLE